MTFVCSVCGDPVAKGRLCCPECVCLADAEDVDEGFSRVDIAIILTVFVLGIVGIGLILCILLGKMRT